MPGREIKLMRLWLDAVFKHLFLPGDLRSLLQSQR